jgi:two-component system chemotaxis response regulator CheY
MSKILIADDSEFMRKILRDILVENGHTDITEASNGNEVLENLKTGEFDLLLLDIIMPEKAGIDVLKDLKGKGPKTIVISAVGQDAMMKDAKDNGALGYLVKPFDAKQVMDEVNKVIG